MRPWILHLPRAPARSLFQFHCFTLPLAKQAGEAPALRRLRQPTSAPNSASLAQPLATAHQAIHWPTPDHSAALSRNLSSFSCRRWLKSANCARKFFRCIPQESAGFPGHPRPQRHRPQGKSSEILRQAYGKHGVADLQSVAVVIREECGRPRGESARFGSGCAA